MTETGTATAARGKEPLMGARHPRKVAGLTGIDLVVFALIVGQLVLRGWASFSGWFYQDDFLFAADAVTHRLDSDYLTHAYNGHVMPGAWLWVWAQVHVAGMSWGFSVLVQLAVQAVTSLSFWALLRMWFGPRLVLVLPMAFYLFSPLTLGAYLWWASAVNHQPMQLATVGALYAHLRYIRTGRWRYGAAAALFIGIGLLFFEKSVVIVPLLFGVSLMVQQRGSLLGDAWHQLRRRWALWALYVSVSAAFYVFYFAKVDDVATPERSSLRDVVDFALTAFGNAIVPSLLGGPWQWTQAGFLGLAQPNDAVKYVSWVLVAALVIETSRRIGGAARIWLVVTGYLVIDLVLVVIGRLSYVGPELGREFRYVADASTIIAFALSLVLTSPAATTARRVASERVAAFRAAVPYLIGAYLLSCWFSTTALVDIWRRNPAETYFSNLQRDVATGRGTMSVHDREVPNEILLRLSFPKDRISNMLKPFPHQPRYDDPSLPLKVADDEGHLRDAVIQPARASRPGPVKDCGYRAENGSVSVPLDDPLFPWDWTWRVAYLTGSDYDVRVTIGEQSRKVRLHGGLNAFFIRSIGAHDTITISNIPDDVALCVTEAVVGTPQPLGPQGTG